MHESLTQFEASSLRCNGLMRFDVLFSDWNKNASATDLYLAERGNSNYYRLLNQVRRQTGRLAVSYLARL